VSARPPRWLALLGRLLIRGKHREFVLGDLDELYARRLGRRGRLRASFRYVRDVLAALPAGRAVSADKAPEPGTRPRRRTTPEDMFFEVRHAARALARQPAFTLVLVMTLALGTGPTIAVLSIAEQLLTRPLPGAANSAPAAYLRLLDPGSELAEFTPKALTLQEFDALRADASLVAGVASYGLIGPQVSVDGGRPVRISAQTIYGDFFEVLGVEASEGRLISAAETDLDADPLVMVITEELRSRLFGSDGEAVGRIVQVDGHSVEVVGVAAEGFRGPMRGEARDAWLPLGALVPLIGFTEAHLRSPRSAMHGNLLVLPGQRVPAGAVEEQVATLLRGYGEAHPERSEVLAKLTPAVVPGLHMPPEARERTFETLGTMSWAVGLLLAIACANVASLLLFQSLARRGAFATLRALGATTGRVARQHLLGSLLVAAMGVASGAGLAWGMAALFRGEVLLGMPEFEGIVFDPVLVTWIAGALVVTTLLFGVLPAVTAGRFDLADALRASGARDSGRMGAARAVLSSGQIALALALSVGGLLMFRTLLNIQAVDTGVDVEHVVGAWFESPGEATPEQWHALQRRVLAAVSADPGVEVAALDMFGPHGSQSMQRVGLPGGAAAQMPLTLTWQVSPGWFDLFGLDVVAGRPLEDADWRVPSTEAAILTASLARRLFGAADAVGRSVWIDRANPEERRVVGVVRDYTSLITVRAATVEAALRPSGPTDAVFLPFADPYGSATVFAKIDPSLRDGPARVQAAMESVLQDAPSPEPYLLQDRVDRIHREERLLSRLLLTLAALGALISGVGLFAAIFFMVASRKRELGIRVALGADAIRILKLVTRSAAAIVLGGVAAGLLMAYPLSSALRSRLYGVEHLDPVSYGTAALALGLVAFLACLAPAREALRADPVAVLREE
jgi:putative ABC transport system permease protein